jgi:nucleotide-binding universal stress UspA family protein
LTANYSKKEKNMKEIHKIIVPIDFLEHTDQIIEYAGYIAQKFDARLYLVHVVEPPPTYAGYEYPSIGSFDKEMMELAEKMMKELVERKKGLLAGCERKILRGEIIDSIVHFAEDKKGDLIVIGTHGRKGLSKMWLGSVAERVIKSAPCPTLTCNPYKQGS